MSLKTSQLPESATIDEDDFLIGVIGNQTRRIRRSNFPIYSPVRKVIEPTGDATTDTATLQAAIDEVVELGGGLGGTVVCKSGTWLLGEIILKDKVNIEGEGRNKTIFKKRPDVRENLFVSENFDTHSFSDDAWVGISYLSMRNFSIDGNQINQPESGATTDWRDNKAMIKIYG